MCEVEKPGGHFVWKPVGLIALVFFYFLIFAQFAYLHLLDARLPGGVKLSMALMAAGGLSGSLLSALSFRISRSRGLLLVGFVGAGAMAFVAPHGSSFGFFYISFAVGLFVGLLTVSLIGYLAYAVPSGRLGRVCGWGTGLAYFFSNVPTLFTDGAAGQSTVAGAACLGGILLTAMTRNSVDRPGGEPSFPQPAYGFSLMAVLVVVFTVLIWLDSAAFRIIQSDRDLLAESWSGSINLWVLGTVHLCTAVLSGYWMDRGRWLTVFIGAVSLLALGYWGIAFGLPGSMGGWFYASGVSLYSAALVAVVLVVGASDTAARRAGWLFGIAGWIGSGLGIGMADDLGSVPVWFWVVAFILVVGCGLLFSRRIKQCE